MRLNNKQKELIAQQIVDELNSTLPKINALDYDKAFEKDLEISKKIAKLNEEIEFLKKVRKELANAFNEKLKNNNSDFDINISYYSSLINPKYCHHKDIYSKNLILDKIELASLDAKDIASLIENIKSSL